MTVALAALFGLLLGSFLNVCIYRIPRDLGVVVRRSFCPECGAQIAAADNIPLVSFLLLRRRCRHCQASISWRYPAVELITGLLFAAIVSRYGITAFALKWLIFECLMIILFWTDLEGRILPDEITLGGLLPAIGCAFFVQVPSVLLDLLLPDVSLTLRSLVKLAISAVVLLTPIWIVALLYSKLRQRDGLGMGDLKLLALMGSFLGLENGIFAMMLASVAGSLVGLFLVFRNRRRAPELELPFGSFLCAGAAILPFLRQLS